MRSLIVIGLSVVSAAAAAAAAQQFDMAAIQKWNAAKVVHYRIAGVYRGTVPIAAGSAAQYSQAQVSDGFTVEVDVELPRLTVVGTPKFTNVKSEVTGIASPGMVKCPPPVPQGPYEYFEITRIVGGDHAAMELQGTRTYPAIGVSSQWPATCAQQTVTGATETVNVTIAVPSPVMLALPANADPKFAVSADRKSFVLKAEDWTWTYTPSIVK